MAAFTGQQMKEFSMAKYYSLKGQTAVVTGDSTGLGLAITRCLISSGAKVVVLSMESEEQAATLLQGAPPSSGQRSGGREPSAAFRMLPTV